jgi:DNA polymerase-3 subunit beta
MKFSVEKHVLVPKLADVVSVIGVRQVTPSLNGVVLEISDQGILTLRGSNGYVQLVETLELQKFAPGAVLLPGKQLLSIVQSAPNGALLFQDDDSRVHIKAAQANFKITKMAYDQYPPFPKYPSTIGQISGVDFREAIESVLVSVMKGEDHPVFSGVIFRFEGETLTLYSTDRYRVSKYVTNWKPQQAITKSVLIKGSVLASALRSFGDKPILDLGAAFGVGDDDTPQSEEFDAQLFGLNSTEQFLTTQVLDISKYPPIAQLFEDKYENQVIVNREQILECLERASVVSPVGEPVKLKFFKGKIEISAGDESEADIFETVDADLSDGVQGVTVYFNPNYLVEGIRALKQKFLRIQIQTEIKPVEFTGRDSQDSPDNPDFRYILVPIRPTNS